MNLNLQKLFQKKRSVTITEYDPTYKVIYLGNVLTAWAKGEGCSDKPLATLWKNYCTNAKPDVVMKVTVGNSGLKAVTKEHGLTEYWANRITHCSAPVHHPRVFCWVYRHEGKRLRQELRCHAVLCRRTRGEHVAHKMAEQLQAKLAESLQEFRREKISRQNARLSLANSVYDNPSLPRRKILLCTGSAKYRPPVERSKSAPKLMAIFEESIGEEACHNKPTDEDEDSDERRGSRMNTTTRVQFELTYPDTDYDGRDEEEEEVGNNHHLNVLNNSSRSDEQIETMNCNELDDIEVCLFDPDPDHNDPERYVTVDAAAEDLLSLSFEESSSSSTSSSASTSPSISNGGVGRRGGGHTIDEVVSDESGYSEDNGNGGGSSRGGATAGQRSRHGTGPICSCTI